MNPMAILAATNPTPQQLPVVLAQYQTLLQQLGGGDGGMQTSTNNMMQWNPMGSPGATAAQSFQVATGGGEGGGGPSHEQQQQQETHGPPAAVAAAAARQSPGNNSPPPRKKRKYDHESFPEKLHRLLSDSHSNGNTDICRFSADGSKFQIVNTSAFEEEVLPHYFRHNRISSFKRLLRMYAFRRIQGKPNRCCTRLFLSQRKTCTLIILSSSVILAVPISFLPSSLSRSSSTFSCRT